MTKGKRPCGCCQKKTELKGNPGPKPSNVATFAKRKRMSMGGLV